MNEAGVTDIRLERIERALALGGLALIAATWRLWTPQNLFPRIPLVEAIAGLPSSVCATATWIACAMCCSALLAIAIAPSRPALHRLSTVVVAASFFALVLLDQHRLQPWCVHISVCLLIAAFAHRDRRLNYLIWFTASIYVYSALGKFDAQFLHTVGQDFLTVIFSSIGLDANLLPYRSRFWLATGFPCFELCVGVGLLLRRTRSVAAAAAIAMHAMLLWVLGPWGLQHAWGVLLWNCLFIAQNLLMLIPAAPREGKSSSQQLLPLRFGLTELVLLCWIVLPMGERFGLVDHWLGWALYAPHSSRVHIEISAAAARDLPAIVERYVQCDAEEQTLWCDVRIDRWSLATLGAPITPQQRFQIGVARALTRFVEEHEIRANVLSTADRWTGRRREHQLRGSAEISAAGDRYWFNTTPRFDPFAD